MRITVVAPLSLITSTIRGRTLPLMQELEKRGHKVTLFLLHHDYANLWKRKFNLGGMQIEYLGQMSVIKRNGQKIYFPTPKLLAVNLQSLFKFFWKILWKKTDLIYVVKPLPVNFLPAVLIKILKFKKMILDADDLEVAANRLTATWQEKIILFIEKFGVKFCHYIFVCSPYLKTYYLNLGMKKNKIIFLPTGFSQAFGTLESDKEIKHLKLFLKPLLDKKNVFLYLGSLSISTGHRVDLLLQSFQLFLKSHRQYQPNTILIIAGSGEDEEKLKNLSRNLGIEKHVVFTGGFQEATIPSLVDIASVLVDPVDDSLTNKAKSSSRLVTAIYFSKPVIAGKTGIREVYLQDFPELLYHPRDKADFSYKMSLVLEHYEKISERFSAFCQEKKKEIEWENLAKKVHDLLIR